MSWNHWFFSSLIYALNLPFVQKLSRQAINCLRLLELQKVAQKLPSAIRTSLPRQTTLCVRGYCWHETNKIYEGYKWSSIKLHAILIEVFMVFSRLHGLFEASFYEITFSWRSLKEESPFLLLTASEQFITLIDFIRLMSTIINHKHIVWSAHGPTR